MDFFKSVVSGDGDQDPSLTDSQPNSQSLDSAESAPTWRAFGGLIRNLTTRSESVIQAYRRDLQEFGSELKKEIQVVQGSLGAVGTAIDDLGTSVLKETAQIISHGKEVILAAGQEEPESSSGANTDRDTSHHTSNLKGYSRFDAQVRALQQDISTYCEEPDDIADYGCWREGFVLDAQREEIESLLSQETGDVKNMFDKVVPGSVDDATFWFRYFYKVFRLKKAEDLRANIVKRAISPEDAVEEELSWDIDDDDDDDDENEDEEVELVKDDRNLTSNASLNIVDSKCSQVKEITEDKHEFGLKPEVALEREKEEKKVLGGEVKRSDESAGETAAIKKVVPEESGQTDIELLGHEIEESNRSNSNGKESDFSVVPNHPSLQEEDLEWDEIEDLSTIDDKRTGQGGRLSTARADMQKLFNTPEEEEEEDLSWDIDDDESPKVDKTQ